MARLNIAPTKSNLLAMKEQLAVSTNGYELLEEKREILVRELMRLVEQVKILEDEIDKAIEDAYPAFKRMLMLDGADQVERISHSIPLQPNRFCWIQWPVYTLAQPAVSSAPEHLHTALYDPDSVFHNAS